MGEEKGWAVGEEMEVGGGGGRGERWARRRWAVGKEEEVGGERGGGGGR
jgi:hypothetical protein